MVYRFYFWRGKCFRPDCCISSRHLKKAHARPSFTRIKRTIRSETKLQGTNYFHLQKIEWHQRFLQRSDSEYNKSAFGLSLCMDDEKLYK